MLLTREEYALQPQDWILIIIEECGLSRDVMDCLSRQLEKFEEYTKNWYRKQYLSDPKFAAEVDRLKQEEKDKSGV
jgi:CO dehydrogenase/acetyl-CoA synthase alpha subunit